jgi:hypothetical protein
MIRRLFSGARLRRRNLEGELGRFLALFAKQLEPRKGLRIETASLLHLYRRCLMV